VRGTAALGIPNATTSQTFDDFWKLDAPASVSEHRDKVGLCRFVRLAIIAILLAGAELFAQAAEADLILHGGKVVTVDERFSIQEAIAVEGETHRAGGPQRRDAATPRAAHGSGGFAGATGSAWLMDSHAHPRRRVHDRVQSSSPPMESIPDVLDYIASRRASAQGRRMD